MCILRCLCGIPAVQISATTQQTCLFCKKPVAPDDEDRTLDGDLFHLGTDCKARAFRSIPNWETHTCAHCGEQIDPDDVQWSTDSDPYHKSRECKKAAWQQIAV
jgi:hypothetical protein